LVLSEFLIKRPNAEKLVKNHILPSMPHNGGYAEILNDFQKDFQQKQQILNALYTSSSRPDFNELERRGYVPSEYIAKNYKSMNNDFKSAATNYIKRRKKSRTDLEKHLINRPKVEQLINRSIINKDNQRRKSQELEHHFTPNDDDQSDDEIQIKYAKKY